MNWSWTVIRYPSPLSRGSKIAITAISSGVPAPAHARLERVIADIQAQGYEIIEGDCLRSDHKHVSAPAEQRAEEFMRFALDDTIDAIAPPWGGELAMELLPLLDFKRLADAEPKWVFGFSDVSTLTAPLCAQCQWATVHSANLIDLVSTQTDPLTSSTLSWMHLEEGQRFTQCASEHFQNAPISFEDNPAAPLSLTKRTQWKILTPGDGVTPDRQARELEVSGRLIGGCLDTLGHLLQGPYIDLRTFAREHNDAKPLLYLENVELTPAQLVRTLLGLKLRGVFGDLAGLIIGRNAGPEVDDAGLGYGDALESTLSDLACPVMYDVDIGHKPPNLTLFNGAWAHIRVADGRGEIEQRLI